MWTYVLAREMEDHSDLHETGTTEPLEHWTQKQLYMWYTALRSVRILAALCSLYPQTEETDSKVGKIIALHMPNLGLIACILYGSLNISRRDS